MEDILDIEVPDQEMYDLIKDEEELGEEWPDKGMKCPVPNCPSAEHHFNNIGNYHKHFGRFHQKNIILYKCPVCGVKDAKKSEVTRHWRRSHKGIQVRPIPHQIVPNNKYIDPGNFKRPRRRIHREERELARVQRQRSLPSTPLFELTEHYNARDHRYPHGGFK